MRRITQDTFNAAVEECQDDDLLVQAFAPVIAEGPLESFESFRNWFLTEIAPVRTAIYTICGCTCAPVAVFDYYTEFVNAAEAVKGGDFHRLVGTERLDFFVKMGEYALECGTEKKCYPTPENVYYCYCDEHAHE